jgi:hypothetical protein
VISDVPREFQRPKGFRFAFGGVNLRDKPDALPPTKYAAAKNIRGTEQSITTRPGYTQLFATGINPITDLRAYSRLGTDNIPRFLARDSANSIYLDSGAVVATLGGFTGQGVSMIPFRPGGSAQSWMYIASSDDYQKLSAPSALGAVTAQKVGIAEPQTALEATPFKPYFTNFSNVAAGWLAGGTAAGLANEVRIADTALAVFPEGDPAPPLTGRFVVLVSQVVPYQIGQLVVFNGVFVDLVQDVIPSIPPNLTLTIQAIRYHSGATGRCTIVPSQLPLSVDPSSSAIAGLRRNALLTIGGEDALVLSVTPGPDGSVSFETEVAGTYAPGTTMGGFKSIVVGSPVIAGAAISSANITANVATGIGTLTQNLAPNPFATNLAFSSAMPQQDDYIHLSLYVSDPTLLTETKVIFEVDATLNDYESNVYYYPLRPSDIAKVAHGTETQKDAALAEAGIEITGEAAPGSNFGTMLEPGATQWTEVTFPISSLIRVGGDLSRSMTNTKGVRVWVKASGPIVVKVGSIWVGGGGQPDVGADGADYRYRAVPRSSLTGVRGNATPDMRYGVRPRRQGVVIGLPSAAYDTQIDTWDIYRYGGSVTSWRYLASVPSNFTFLTDNYFDDAVRAGDPLETDNFEPWPSIDAPFKADLGATGQVTGTFAVVANPSGWPTSITRWLPGTLIRLEDQRAYTLRRRPTLVAGTTYLFEFEECAGFGPTGTFEIREPRVARQTLPYLWGPDAAGTFFGCGDPLRPGRVYESKSYEPDSAPDANSQELCPPSEPLIGGEIANGVALVASTTRWWALYPAFQTPRRYDAVERNVGRPLIAPFAHCTDGQKVFFWTRDCIAVTDGGPFVSLTTDDLYPIFSHEGVPGRNITRHGVTYYAPDYQRAATFRLSFARPYLYADYQDSNGSPRTLVLDMRNGAWSQDIYADPITAHYAVEQQAGPLLGGLVALYPITAMASVSGKVYYQEECADDDGSPISCLVATFEWDGDDQRSQDLWGDGYLDSEPEAAITVTPVTLESGVATPTVVASSPSRQFTVVSLDGGTIKKFLGYKLEWNEWI